MADTDPAYPDEQPTAPLARYTYTAAENCGRCMTAAGRRCAGLLRCGARRADGGAPLCREAGEPYRYDDTGRVTEQVNPEGLDYALSTGRTV